MNTDASNPLEADRQELSRQFIRELLWNPTPDLDAVLSATPDECFPPGHHREVVATVRRLRSQGLPADITTLGAELPGAAAFLAESMNYIAIGSLSHVAAKLRTVAATIEARRQMADYASRGTDLEGARAELDRIAQRFHLDTATGDCLAIPASVLLTTDPAEVKALLLGLFDAGDKLLIIGSSKSRKTFMVLNLALLLAAGRRFLKWPTVAPVRVLICQFEITAPHFHRRVLKVAKGLDIAPEDIGDRLTIHNGRGKPWNFQAIARMAKDHRAELIIIDPLYKLATGDENAAGDIKPTLLEFDRLAEQTGAAVAYVHHDPKGIPGQRDIRDRGAGSNVIVRDCDAMLTISPHRAGDDASVIGVLARNYPPTEDFSVEFHRGTFEVSDMPAEVATAATKGTTPTNGDGQAILAILGDRELTRTRLETEARKTGLSDIRIRRAIAAGVDEGVITDRRGPNNSRLFRRAGKGMENPGSVNTCRTESVPNRLKMGVEKYGDVFNA